MGLTYPNSMSTFYLALTTSPNQWSSVKEEKCCSLQSKKGITAATTYNALIFTKHKGRSQLVVPFREKNLIPPARGLPEGIDQHIYMMMLCVYTKSQQCHALRTVQNAELSKETARKEPGYMPFVSFLCINISTWASRRKQESSPQCCSSVSTQARLGFC